MNQFRLKGLKGLVLAALLAAVPAYAQTGPDVIVGNITGPSNYGVVGGIAAYALGTDSCNIGTVPLQWVSSTNQHPVIAQNVYRINAEGRFEMVGMSWLKHGFTALAQNLCATCQNPGTGSLLGVNCSDPYSSSLNGGQSGLGPRFEVNAATGAFVYPFTSPAFSGAIARRLQVATTDVDPANPANSGAIYLGECQYVTPDDATAGNKNNNTSYRRMSFAAGTFAGSFPAATVRMKAAIEGWKDLDPTVVLNDILVPNDGRMILGLKTVSLPGGVTRFHYALYNQNSDRSASAVRFTMPAGATVSNLSFHDVPYHSGEPFNSIDWASSFNGSEVAFACTETFASNPSANALRWGTTYSFSFDSTAAPSGIRIDLFKPGTPSFMSIGPVFTLDLATAGGGLGNFHLGLDNIPSGAIEGFCVFSLNTSLALGAGGLLGLNPDSTSIVCLTSPRFAGNILHWEWPTVGLFPAVDFDLPNGSLPFPAGTKTDGVAFAIGSSASYLGATAPVRITF